jgi:hypothetical protein
MLKQVRAKRRLAERFLFPALVCYFSRVWLSQKTQLKLVL